MERYSEGSRSIDESAEHIDMVEQLRALQRADEVKAEMRLRALRSLVAEGVNTVDSDLLAARIDELSTTSMV